MERFSDIHLSCLAVCLVMVISQLVITEAWPVEYISVGDETKIVHRTKRAAVKDEKKQGLTHDERIEFMNKHNTLRSLVSPKASNMQKLVWEPELESMAQGWANKCDWKHGQPWKRDPEPYKNIGQNMWKGNGGYNIDGAVSSWYNEIKDYDFATKKCASGKVCGHYTQVVRATSQTIGCGINTCEGGKYWMIVCNYGPYGSSPVYNTGTPCSDCASSHTAGCENNLCTAGKCFEDADCGDGTLDPDTCVCKCPEGVTGAKCGGNVSLMSPLLIVMMLVKALYDTC